MRYERRICLMLTGLLIVLYIGFSFFYRYDKNQAPVITFDKEIITVKANHKVKQLLKGVTATDQEDGDLTSDIMIDQISAFNSEKERTITYVVFDNDKKCTTAQRKLKYKNYKKPVIRLNDSLIGSTLSMTKINRLIEAESCVDGDISANVEVKTGTYDDHKLPLAITVTDSTGTESVLNCVYEYDNTNYTADIVLNQYVIYLKLGETTNLYDNVKAVMVGNNESEVLTENITIARGKLDISKKGVYEIYYSLNRDTNYTAKCKALVVVY